MLHKCAIVVPEVVKRGVGMNLIKAELIAKRLIKELGPFCDRIEVVGSVRRRKQYVNDIDILLAPKGEMLFDLMGKIVALGSEDGMKIASKKTILLKDASEEIKAELWFTTLERWPVTLLVRTGGTKSNKKIAKLCENKKWHLSVSSGSILDESGKKLPINEETDIFKLLGIPYVGPSWRE